MGSTEGHQRASKWRRDTRSPLPRPLPYAGYDPLSPSQGQLPASPRGSEAEPEPEAGRQDTEVPGSTPRLCPSFSGHPKKEGAAGKGKERKYAVSWEVLGRQVLS